MLQRSAQHRLRLKQSDRLLWILLSLLARLATLGVRRKA
jgi:hypothetical protein